MLDTLRGADTIGSAATRLAHDHLGMQHITIGTAETTFRRRWYGIYTNFRDDRLGFSVVRLMVLTLGAFYVGVRATAILTAGITSSSFGLSTSSICGWWLPFGSTANNTKPTSKRFWYITTEDPFEAVNYAKSQYGTAVAGNAASDYIVERIVYHNLSNQPCPFANKLCRYSNAAFGLDTGL